MPSSCYTQISIIVWLIKSINPMKMLDVGIGFGKYGFLAREYLELWDERNKYNDWKRQIDGIEGCPSYITSLQKTIYNKIYYMNVLHALAELDAKRITYDLIIMIDVLEHFDRETGLSVLKKLTKIGKNVVISTPKKVSNQGAVFNNPLEEHKHEYKPEDFDNFNTLLIEHEKFLIYWIK